MQYRVHATIPQLSSSGVAYRHTVWMHTFDELDHEEEEAKQIARDAIFDINPNFKNYSLEIELVMPWIRPNA